MKYNFTFKGNVGFGPGSRKSLIEILKKNNFNNIVLIVDNNLINNELIISLLNSIKERYETYLITPKVGEPTYNDLESLRISKTDFKADVFIGIGGGSTIDIAKALSVLYSNNKSAILYRGFNEYKLPIKPIIAIPTTAGTGTEVTPNASFVDTIAKKKMGINGEEMRPSFSILDPELNLSCPLHPTISAAVDSLVHSTEAYVAKKSNPLSQLFSREGFTKVFESLPHLIDNLNNVKFREEVMYGAFLSGVALMNSGTGPAAALSYPLGVHFNVPHGIGGGIFLPKVIRKNIERGFYNYSGLFTTIDNITNKKENSLKLLDEIDKLWEKLKIPTNLNTYCIDIDDISQITSDTLELSGALEQNPSYFGKTEIQEILNELIRG